MKNFDLIILGSGSAGLAVAYPLREKGWSVAVVDNKPFGGTCANRGCDPKKVLVGVSESLDWFCRYSEKGILVGDAKINWEKLMSFKQKFVENIPSGTEESLKKNGIEIFHGAAKFVDKNIILVNDQTLKAKYIVLAAGSSPMKLNIPGEEFTTISDDFLNLKPLPKRIVFIGGGYISFEFAHVSKRAGAQVTILHRSERVLTGFDPDLVDLLVKASKDLGLKVALNTPVVSIEKTAKSLLVHTKSKNGAEKSFEADLVVHGAGRTPNVASLNLEKAGVEFDQKGVKVNEYLESVTNAQVLAAGDVADFGLPLTPVAAKAGQLIALNLLNPKQKRQAQFKEIPSVVFTIPPLATVGLTEQQIKQKGLEYEVKFGETSGWYSSHRINEKFSGYKTFIEKGTGKILGANLLGHGSEELINIFALAIFKGLTAQDLKDLIYAYPTRSSDIEYMV